MKATTFFSQVLPLGPILTATSCPVFWIKHLHFLWRAIFFHVIYALQFYMLQIHWSTYEDGQREIISNIRRLFQTWMLSINNVQNLYTVNTSCFSLEKIGMKTKLMISVSLMDCWFAQCKPSTNKKLCYPRDHSCLCNYFMANHKFQGESSIIVPIALMKN